MRFYDIINYVSETLNISQVKQDIITGVNKTTDEELLSKIRTALYSTSIKQKITNAVGKDSDVTGHLEEVVLRVLNTEGSVEDKIKFADGLSSGFIDLKALTSGQRLHFYDIIKTPTNMSDPPINFVLKVMNELKSFSPGSKGPGEMSLAVLSPQIKVGGTGDLKINGKTVEVKASTTSGGGVLGETGHLSYEEIPAIIKKHFPNLRVETLGISPFKTLLKTISEEKREQVGRELWGYIFHKYTDFVDIKPLIAATRNASDEDINSEFVKAAYRAYQGKNKKFDGVLLINFKTEELQYFSDPNELAKNILALDAQLISKQSARLIIPRTTLARRQMNKPSPVKKSAEQSEITRYFLQLAEWLVIKHHSPNSLIDPISQYMEKLYSQGVSIKDIPGKTIEEFKKELLRGSENKPLAQPQDEPIDQNSSQEPAQEPTEQPALETILRNAGLK